MSTKRTVPGSGLPHTLPIQALRAATVISAELIGVEDRGCLAAGLLAALDGFLDTKSVAVART